MRPRHRSGLPVIIPIFLAPATPLLAEIAAVTAFPLTQARWPYGLDLIRRNPFASFMGLAVSLAVITFLLFWWRTRDTDHIEIPTTDIVEITEGREFEKGRSRPVAAVWPRPMGTLPSADRAFRGRITRRRGRLGRISGPAMRGAATAWEDRSAGGSAAISGPWFARDFGRGVAVSLGG